MKRAVARSRCEVAGKVYLPGDHMWLTEAQLAYLLSKKAAIEMTSTIVSPTQQPGEMTPESADAYYLKMVGKPRPKKEKVK